MSANLPQHPLVVRGPVVEALRDAAAILEQARREAAIERARERQRGYDEGLDAAAATASQLIGDASNAVAAFWEQREQELVPLALAIAHRILVDLPPDEVLIGIARTAIAEHRQDAQLTLRVAPEAAVALRRSLAARADSAHVDVQSDASLSLGRCMLSHPRGRASIGLIDQFNALISAAREAS